jgi:hypothetical protein
MYYSHATMQQQDMETNRFRTMTICMKQRPMTNFGDHHALSGAIVATVETNYSTSGEVKAKRCVVVMLGVIWWSVGGAW